MLPLALDIVEVSFRQGLFLASQLMLTMRKVASRAALTAQALHEVLAEACLELLVEGGEDGRGGSD